MNTNVNGVRLHFDCAGQGLPVVLLHGNGEDHTIFDQLMAQLSPQYRVYAIDSRGHGRSSGASELHYADMAEDVAAFIQKLDLKKPVLYGFSDGGIIGLLIAIQYPELLSKLAVSGVNTTPRGLRLSFSLLIRFAHFFTRNPMLKLMLTEPDITQQQLRTIKVPTLLLAGKKDIIKPSHTNFIAQCIPNADLKVLEQETHTSYVVHSEKIYGYLIEFIQNH